jgi:wyosine [tRNA(Phe)-imidazoG37] synthetase (radical SAM superfamily)
VHIWKESPNSCRRFILLSPTYQSPHAYQIFSERLDAVEYLIGYEGVSFALTGGAEEDLLSITAVHPMRKDAVRALLSKAEADWSVVEGLVDADLLAETEYSGETFYVRKFH